jgi:hypothetical protein
MWIREAQKHMDPSDPNPDAEHLHHSSTLKSHKEVTKKKKSRFFLLFLLDDKWIWIRACDNGSGCGSGRPKNIRIRKSGIFCDNLRLFNVSTIARNGKREKNKFL